VIITITHTTPTIPIGSSVFASPYTTLMLNTIKTISNTVSHTVLAIMVGTIIYRVRRTILFRIGATRMITLMRNTIAAVLISIGLTITSITVVRLAKIRVFFLLIVAFIAFVL
jgi:ABC-type siderophore export system fused ATPase/permease subunit